jgi:Leucine-rich repeat
VTKVRTYVISRSTPQLTHNLQDQHDAIDFTDNSLVALSNLPLLNRLRTLLLANNRISTISSSLHLSAPNLTTLILTNNNITELGDLEPLKDVKGLKYLSLLGNPVGEKKWYREWLAWRLPGLRVLDFQRIRDKVRLCVQSGHTSSIRVVGETSSEGLVLDRRWTHEFPRYYIINDRVDRHCKERHNGRGASRCCGTWKGWSAFDQGRGQQG